MPRKKQDKLCFKKNEKRKKAIKKSLQHIKKIDIDSLKVSIPTCKISVPKHMVITKARDISHLYTVLTVSSNLFPSTWSLSMEGCDAAVLFCYKLKCDMSQLTSAVLMTVVIQNNFEWSLSCMAHIMEKSCPALHGQPELLQTPQDVVALLTVLDQHKVCIGNNDERFIHLLETRKGAIKDQCGKHACIAIIIINS